MLHIPDIHLDIRKTQFYQDVYVEGELKGELKVIVNLLKRRFGELNNAVIEQIKSLELTQLDCLADNLLEFKQVDELVNWLNQLNLPTPKQSS